MQCLTIYIYIFLPTCTVLHSLIQSLLYTHVCNFTHLLMLSLLDLHMATHMCSWPHGHRSATHSSHTLTGSVLVSVGEAVLHNTQSPNLNQMNSCYMWIGRGLCLVWPAAGGSLSTGTSTIAEARMWQITHWLVKLSLPLPQYWLKEVPGPCWGSSPTMCPRENWKICDQFYPRHSLLCIQRIRHSHMQV